MNVSVSQDLWPQGIGPRVLKPLWPAFQVPSDDSVAQKRFANAKSISSAQFFGNESQANSRETEVRLQRFAVSSASCLQRFGS